MKYNLQGQEMSMIKKMEMEAAKLSGTVSLAQGVPWYGVPPHVMEFLTEKIASGQTNRYSIVPGIPPLREKVALKYMQKNNVELSIDEIIITAGAIQAITDIFLTLFQPGDEVIFIDPCYASYNGCARVAHGVPVYVPLDENLDLDVEALLSKITDKTRCIVFANPNNPTGSIFSLAKIKQILDFIKGKDILLCLDEVYDEFIYDGQEFESAIALYPQYKENLIIINSWSKSFGMTGWRVGYFVAHPEIAKEILKIHDSLITCAPVHSQRAALATFEIYDERTHKVRHQLQEKRDFAVQRLSHLTDFIEFSKPGAAYFVFPKFRYTDDDLGECVKILHEAKLSLVPGGGFGPGGKGHFRICFGRDFDDLREGLKRLERYFIGD